MTVSTVIYGKGYRVQIKQGHQYFHLDYDGNKAECRWMAKMFRLAIRNHNNELLRSNHDSRRTKGKDK